MTNQQSKSQNEQLETLLRASVVKTGKSHPGACSAAASEAFLERLQAARNLVKGRMGKGDLDRNKTHGTCGLKKTGGHWLEGG